MAKLWQFSQGHLKPAFSEKVQRRVQKEIFQKPSKKWPLLKKANSTLAETALSFSLNAVKAETMKQILAQKAAPKEL